MRPPDLGRDRVGGRGAGGATQRNDGAKGSRARSGGEVNPAGPL